MPGGQRQGEIPIVLTHAVIFWPWTWAFLFIRDLLVLDAGRERTHGRPDFKARY